jgi:hypothetical protein
VKRTPTELPSPIRDTVEGYLRTYLDGITSVAPKTRERYIELAERQIYPHLGEVKIRYLTAVEIERWLGTLIRGGLSPQTATHAYRVLARALRRIKNTAALEAERPAIEAKEIEIPTPEQVGTVLTALEGHALHPIVALALRTGMWTVNLEPDTEAAKVCTIACVSAR